MRHWLKENNELVTKLVSALFILIPICWFVLTRDWLPVGYFDSWHEPSGGWFTTFSLATAFTSIIGGVYEGRVKKQRAAEIQSREARTAGALLSVFEEFAEDPLDKPRAYKECLKNYTREIFGTDIRIALYTLDSDSSDENEDENFVLRRIICHSNGKKDIGPQILDPKSSDERIKNQALDMIRRARAGKHRSVKNTHKDKEWIKKFGSSQNYRSFYTYPILRKQRVQNNFTEESAGLLVVDSLNENYFTEKKEYWVIHCAKVLESIYNFHSPKPQATKFTRKKFPK